MVHTLGAVDRQQQVAVGLQVDARGCSGGQAMKLTVFGFFGSRTSTTVMPLLKPWPI